MSLLGSPKAGSTIVSALVVVGFVAVLVLMILKPVAMAAEIADALKILLGTLSAQFGAVVQYHLGSSAGSKSKDDIMRELVTKPAPAAAPPAPQGS